VALVPWLLALALDAQRREPTGLRAFLLGLAAGAVYFTGTLYWIPDVPATYGGLSRLVAVPVGGLLIAYLALFPAACSWALGRMLANHGTRGLWLAPVLWVATEFLRGWLFTGFPWVSLGYSQVTWLPIAQAASLAGVWGLSALLVTANIVIAGLILDRPVFLRGAALAALGLVVLVAWGTWRLRADLSEGTVLRLGIVQGNVPQDQKWSPEYADEILERYLRLSREAAAQGARLLVWPESSIPFYFEEDPVRGEQVRQLARDTRAWLLFGSNQLERGPDPRYYNAVFLVAPDGSTAAVYRKQHLVPFGEYVPLGRLLFFVSPLVEAVSNFSAGTGPVMLPVDGRPVSAAVCYEVIFGALVRDGVMAGSQLLTTVTNDAWYGRSSAPFQHFEQASLRAIEQRRYLVRAANTGVSGLVDPAGRVVARLGLFETGILVEDARFLEKRTVYATIGDSFAWACVLLSAVIVWGRRPTHASR
jgi:apolipoprotein N-acyltransferase